MKITMQDIQKELKKHKGKTKQHKKDKIEKLFADSGEPMHNFQGFSVIEDLESYPEYNE